MTVEVPKNMHTYSKNDVRIIDLMLGKIFEKFSENNRQIFEHKPFLLILLL